MSNHGFPMNRFGRKPTRDTVRVAVRVREAGYIVDAEDVSELTGLPVGRVRKALEAARKRGWVRSVARGLYEG